MDTDHFCFDCSRYCGDAHLLPFREVSRAFKAVDIAALIGSVEKSCTVTDATIEMTEGPERNCSNWFLLVKDGRETVGWLSMDDLVLMSDDIVKDPPVPIIPISVDEVVPASMPLLDLLPVFERHYVVLALTGNEITHVISFQDFDKLPGHICLFSLFAELELEMTTKLYEVVRSGQDPLQWLPEARLTKAHDLYALKHPREDPKAVRREDLVPCTNLIDKITMITKDKSMAAGLDCGAPGSAKKLLKTVEGIRNAVAHGTSLFETIRSPEQLNNLVAQVEQMISTLSKPTPV